MTKDDATIRLMERGQVRSLQLVEFLERAQSDLEALLSGTPPHVSRSGESVNAIRAAWRAREILVAQLKAENAEDIARGYVSAAASNGRRDMA